MIVIQHLELIESFFHIVLLQEQVQESFQLRVLLDFLPVNPGFDVQPLQVNSWAI